MRRLPLMVLYEGGDSWFYEFGQKPVAIFLVPDEVAVYVHDLPKSRYADARNACFAMTEQNYFYRLPTIKELDLWRQHRSEFDKVSNLFDVDRVKPGKYWSNTKVKEPCCRKVLSFLPAEELVMHETQYAFARPFLVM